MSKYPATYPTSVFVAGTLVLALTASGAASGQDEHSHDGHRRAVANVREGHGRLDHGEEIDHEHARDDVHDDASAPGDHGGHDDHAEEGVRLPDAVLDEFGVAVGVVTAETIVRTVTLPGEVRANEERVAHIAPRFPGIVKDVHKSVGDFVSRGDALAVVESDESLAPYALKSELSGVIIARHITRGEPITRETQAFVVADLTDVWVDISVYQRDLSRVRVGQEVAISAGHDAELAQGAVAYVAPVLDEATRTAVARVVLPNPARSWRPGMFVTAEITVERIEVEMAVPQGAVQLIDGAFVVFVEEGGAFFPKPVTLGVRDSRFVEIVDGIRVGDRYVSSGAFTLKTELARDELSGGHSH